ncbi:MAG: hypothetical protein AVDCRST_MAG42-1650 [uncultured Chthoniobacterales bacterium]|uniref:Uncharacterized protein n=1 Tax=uncultured Chthoniobacterales bacterium TaxID=1836801 RepID=A0A6J4I3C5_9BACT|nr:MAG: hypothetical protein AVDCRST_MAG42-1650 [uncultured Chthoniobacterales bacterium]
MRLPGRSAYCRRVSVKGKQQDRSEVAPFLRGGAPSRVG